MTRIGYLVTVRDDWEEGRIPKLEIRKKTEFRSSRSETSASRHRPRSAGMLARSGVGPLTGAGQFLGCLPAPRCCGQESPRSGGNSGGMHSSETCAPVSACPDALVHEASDCSTTPSTTRGFRISAFFLLLLAILFNPLLSPFAIGADISDQEVLKRLTADQPRDRAVRKGLEFLRKQQRADGSASDKYPAALTAMAVMAHFAAGHPPADKEYGPWVRKSINYVLSKQNPDGYFGEADGSRMYGHGICTLMLAEALGMPRDDEMDEVIRKALKQAVRVTVNAALVKKAPEHAGGWRYTPNATDSDLSLSGWQLMSLHATQQVGIPVPESVITGAVEYTRKMVNDDGRVGYQNPNEDRPALRGLALLAFVIGHQDKAPVVKKIAERIWADPLTWKKDRFYYRAYYDAVGISRALPEEWEKYLPQYEAALLPHQNEDGSFDPSADGESKDAGPTYSTSMAVMALAVQRYVLPAYQR